MTRWASCLFTPAVLANVSKSSRVKSLTLPARLIWWFRVHMPDGLYEYATSYAGESFHSPFRSMRNEMFFT